MKAILVADDNPASRELVVGSLEGEYDLIEASNGQEALDRLLELRPALAIIDIQMPVLDGFGVIAGIRGDLRLRDMPAIALTAFAMESDREKIDAAGFNAYVTKPFKISELRHLVRQLLA